jgi:hypothetical protein
VIPRGPGGLGALRRSAPESWSIIALGLRRPVKSTEKFTPALAWQPTVFTSTWYQSLKFHATDHIKICSCSSTNACAVDHRRQQSKVLYRVRDQGSQQRDWGYLSGLPIGCLHLGRFLHSGRRKAPPHFESNAHRTISLCVTKPRPSRIGKA